MKPYNEQEFNKLCAEFLGWKEDFAHESDEYGYIQTVDGYMTPFINVDIIHSIISEYNISENIHSITQLKFDSDWNWIMEVVEKISINYDWSIEKVVGVYQVLIPISQTNVINTNKKEAVVQAIWQFLNWYNEQKQ